jgi:hypothetical protein
MTDKVNRTLDITKPVEEQIAEFRQNATDIIQSTPAILLIAVDPKNPEHGVISGGIGDRDKMLEIMAAAMLEDKQLRKLFEEAYRTAMAAMIEEAKCKEEEPEPDKVEAVVIPFRVPITKNLQ